MNQPTVIKIGSNVLRSEDGNLDFERLSHLVFQLSRLKQQGESIVVVSSGAVASGRNLFPKASHLDSISQRQLWASIGQVKLIETYAKEFLHYYLLTAQVLVTKEDFRDRNHYLNMKNCFTTLLEHDVIPIVNENDVISVTELMFTDNDELAGLVASMVNAKKLIILTNVDGVYNGNPNSPDSRLIPEIRPNFSDEVSVISPEKSHFGRGGMLTKFKMAKKTASLGIPVHISNGKKDNILLNIFSGKSVGTVFMPDKKASTTKKWLAHAHSALAGFVVIDSGAVQALKSANPTSLLFVGIKHVEGQFKKGDIIEILDENTRSIGIGKTMFDAEKSRELKGKKGQKECIHYDYLYLNP